MTLDLSVLVGGLHLNSKEETRRIFHGRGHAYPGFEDLVVDYYPPVLVVAAYREGYPLAEISALLQQQLEAANFPLVCILAQHRYQRQNMWEVVYGSLPEQLLAREAGLVYELSLMKHQNVGFFPDMRLGRALAARLAPGKRVLNLFAYTCSFSVAVMAAGAQSCHNMDLSKAALSVGRNNHRLNDLDLSEVRFLGMNVLKSIGRLKREGPFDLVVIDPPSRQDGFIAERDYPRLVRRLPEFLAPNAHILACLNAPHLPPSFLLELFEEGFAHVAMAGRPEEYVESEAERALKIGHFRLK